MLKPPRSATQPTVFGYFLRSRVIRVSGHVGPNILMLLAFACINATIIRMAIMTTGYTSSFSKVGDGKSYKRRQVPWDLEEWFRTSISLR